MDLAAQENLHRAEKCEHQRGLALMSGEKAVKIGEGTFANVYKGGSDIEVY